MRERGAWAFSFMLLLTLMPPPAECRRGGGLPSGRSMGRGTSGARSGGLFNSGRSRGQQAPVPTYQRKTHIGGNNGGGYRPQQTGHNTGSNWGQKTGGYQRPQTSTYTKGRGVGSVFRSNTFKNAIVGAAAGYLTYQAGKAIIRAAAGPMMWNNRPYYWGSQYYQPRHGGGQMCRMPMQQGDQQFGNVYFQDQTRPREIVWGCGYYEYCCGYECCRGGGASSTFSHSIGYTFVLFYILRHYLF